MDVFAIPSLLRPGLFLPVSDRLHSYQCLQILFVPRSVVKAYYSSPVISQWASELSFRIEISDFCHNAFVSFILSALVSGPVGFSNEIASVESTHSKGVPLSLPDGVHNCLRSAGFSGTMSD